MFAHAQTWLMVIAAATAGQLDTRGLVEQALDEPTQIALENIPLGEAIRQIAQQSGVTIIMPLEVMELVPYGAETVVRQVEIANIPLREGLTELLAPLGMVFEVRGGAVVVMPKPALLCLGRAPTWTELDTLGELSAMEPGVREEDLTALRGRVQFQVGTADGWAALSEAIRSVGAGPGDEVLSVACAKIGWVWCLSDRQIVVSSAAHQLRRQLQWPVSLRMNSRSLIDVLTEVGRYAGVTVRAEPGALASLPLHVQKNFSLNVSHMPAEQVFERIAAETGLGYLVEADGVLFFKVIDARPGEPDTSEGASASPPARDPYVGKVVIELEDGKTIEWFVRRSELPQDLRDRRAQDLQEAFEAIRRQSDRQRP